MECLINVLILTLVITLCSSYKYKSDACFKRQTPNIPADHLFFKKNQPLILGHRGQPKKYQENTLDGIKSLIGTGADGFTVDAHLTKNGDLVAFNAAASTTMLTGAKKSIHEMSTAEISKLKYKKTLKYGGKTYTYSNERKVEFLENILNAVKDLDMLIYIEASPPTWSSNVASRWPYSAKVGKEIASLISKLNLQRKVLVKSSDAIKAHEIKKYSPKVPIGGEYFAGFWLINTPSWYADVKYELKKIKGMETCLDKMPSSSVLIDFLHETGSIYKAINASFVEYELDLFDNTKLIKNPVKTLRDNYNKDITFGASTIYNMALNETAIKAKEWKVDNLINQKVSRLITDDVPRLAKKLGRNIASKTNVSLLIVSVACFLSIHISFQH